MVFGINSMSNASRKVNSTRLRAISFSPHAISFLLALLVLLIPITTVNHAITYTYFIATDQ